MRVPSHSSSRPRAGCCGISRVIWLVVCATGAPAADLVPWSSTWRYADDGVNRYAGTAPFYAPVYDDLLWKTGSGRFGYGGDGETTTILFGSNASNKYPSTYFRRDFEWDGSVPPGADALLLEFSRDDGAMIYLNGTLIERSNMPASQVGHTSRAVTVVSDDAETELVQRVIDPALLQRGRNVLAVSVHQNAPDSSDLGFDLRLGFTRRTRFFGQDILMPAPHGVDSVVAAYDLTADGVADLVTTGRSGPTTWLEVRVNDGHGAFGPPQVFEPNIGDPPMLETLDANGDEKPDVIAVQIGTTSDAEIRVYHNEGAGKFTRRTMITAGPLLSAAIGDLDGDGLDDIAEVALEGTSVSLRWRRNQGEGAFAPPVTLIDLPRGTGAAATHDVTMLDADGDGKNDLLLASGSSASVRLFRNQGEPLPTFAVSVAVTGLSYPRAIRAADLDGDGDADFIVVQQSNEAGTLPLRLQTFINSGTGEFARRSASTSLVRGGLLPILYDVDRDGDPDLLYADQSTGVFTLLENDGRGYWVHRRVHETPLQRFHSSRLGVGDINGDGQPDVVKDNAGAFRPVTWYRNTTGAGPSVRSFTASPATIGARTEVLLEWNVENATSVEMHPLVAIAPGATSVRVPVERESTFTLTARNAEGVTTAQRVVFLANLRWSPLVPGPTVEYATYAGAQADLNGDGRLDLLFSGYTEGTGRQGIYWAPLREDKTFGPSEQLVLGKASSARVAAADLNGDGRPDVVAAVPESVVAGISETGLSWIPVLADGVLGETRQIIPSTFANPLGYHTLGDFDADGDVDIGYRPTGTDFQVWRNDGTGQFSAAPTTPLDVGFGVTGMGSSDIDRDGRADLILRMERTNTIIGWNNGNQGITTMELVPPPLRIVREVHIADVDGDGHSDLLTTVSDTVGSAGIEIYLELGRGDRLLGTRGGRLVFDSSDGRRYDGLNTADLDRDGDIDLVVGRSSGGPPVQYAFNDGTGRFSDLVNVTSTVLHADGARGMLLGDLEGDGDPDVVMFFQQQAAAVINNGQPPAVIRVPAEVAVSEDRAASELRLEVGGLLRPATLLLEWMEESTASLDEIQIGPPDMVVPVPGQPGRWSVRLVPGEPPPVLTVRALDDADEEAAETIRLRFSSPDALVFDETTGAVSATVTLTLWASDFIYPGMAGIVPQPDGSLLLRFSRLPLRRHALESSLDLRGWTLVETMDPLPDGTIEYLVLPGGGPHRHYRLRDTSFPVFP